MPIYYMKNVETGETKEMFLSLSEREELISSGKWEQQLSTPLIVSGVGSLLKKTSDGWNDVLKSIKKGSGRGNTIKTK